MDLYFGNGQTLASLYNPSHPLRQCKTGLMQYELVRRRRKAVETDKDVMRSLWSWLTWANFEHVHKNRSEDVSEKGRSKDSVET